MTGKPKILMCPPRYYGIEYEINPWMDTRVASDAIEARRQWDGLHEKLIELGASVELMEPAEGLPDLVFTANAGLIYGRLFLSSRFRHEVRQRESPCFDAWFREHGFHVESLPEHLYFEGAGDALFCGETLFVGYRMRSNAGAHLWISDRLGVETLPLELVDSRFYHLDTCFCPLSENEAIVYPGAFDAYGLSVLHERIDHIHAVAPEEATSFSCNAVAVGDSVVLNEGAPKLVRSLRAAGHDVHELPFGEFIKSGGSAKCLTLRLDGEEAASWAKGKAVASKAT